MYLLGFTALQVEKIMTSGPRPPSPWETSIHLMELQLWMTGVVVVMLFLILLVVGIAGRANPRKR